MSEGLQVVFGTGPVGCATAGRLLDKGLRVRMVNRSGRRPSFFAPRSPEQETRLSVAACDAMDESAVRAAAAGASHLYNCAHAPYHQWEAVLPVLYSNLEKAALEQNAVFAAAQNLYMYARGLAVIN